MGLSFSIYRTSGLDGKISTALPASTLCYKGRAGEGWAFLLHAIRAWLVRMGIPLSY